jgi:hypothetical protein
LRITAPGDDAPWYNGCVARVAVQLLDDEERPLETLEVDSGETYELNGYFKTPDGRLFLICEVARGEAPIDTKLTAVWIDGP